MMLTVKLRKIQHTDPQDTVLESCPEPGMLGISLGRSTSALTVPMAEVCRKLGTSEQTLYRRFSSSCQFWTTMTVEFRQSTAFV